MKIHRHDGSDSQTLRGAFTLVELLVVISIIVLLISILLPVLKSAREQARVMGCLSQVRQLGITFLIYSTDYNDTLPTTPDDWRFWLGWGMRGANPDGSTYSYTPDRIYDKVVPHYLSEGAYKELVACPSWPRGEISPHHLGGANITNADLAASPYYDTSYYYRGWTMEFGPTAYVVADNNGRPNAPIRSFGPIEPHHADPAFAADNPFTDWVFVERIDLIVSKGYHETRGGSQFYLDGSATFRKLNSPLEYLGFWRNDPDYN